MAAKLPPRKHPPPVWPYGQHTGNPLPANVPVTAWSDNPGARPPGPYHLGRWPRRGGIQFHRTLSFFGTGHTKILSFSLQENASIPLSNFMAILLAQPTIHTFRPYLIRLIYMGETQLSIFCMRQATPSTPKQCHNSSIDTHQVSFQKVTAATFYINSSWRID